MLPISINNKKIYDTNIDDDISFIDNLTLAKFLIEQGEIIENWKVIKFQMNRVNIHILHYN